MRGAVARHQQSERLDSVLSAGTRESDLRRRTFEVLDGLRGIAALMVVVWHMPGQKFLPSAYMAVDFFFILSGFVLAYQYQDRLHTTISPARFTVMRIIRLYPLYILGSMPGIAADLYDIVRGNSEVLAFGRLTAAAFMMPWIAPGALVFVYNVPAWSLFYELLVNVIYGTYISRWSSRSVATLTLIAGIALAIATIRFGHMRFTGQMPFFLIGFVRTVFGFFAGVLVHTVWARGAIPNRSVPLIMIAAAFVLTFFIPGQRDYTPFVLIICSMVIYPAVVWVSLGAHPSEKMTKLCQFLGQISFPLYAIHYPITVIADRAFGRVPVAGAVQIFIVLTVSVIAAVAALHLYDIPVRRWITRRMFPAVKAPS